MKQPVSRASKKSAARSNPSSRNKVGVKSTKPKPTPSPKRTGKDKAAPDPVKRTLAGFSRYASSGGRLKPGSPQYEARLKNLKEGILKNIEADKKSRRAGKRRYS